ncbi:MAG: SDR family oxidoreductase [Candidatus Woesearchaeota archaeon]
MQLKNKVVLITGSSSGIGKETAILCAKKGAKVVVTYLAGKKDGENVLNECKKHSDAMLVRLDISKESSISKAVRAVLKKFGRIDVLDNNAGVIKWEYFRKQKPKDIEAQVEVNLTGLMKMTLAVLPVLERQDEAVIVNIASGAGKKGHATLVPYCATKFGVRGFTQALAMELPPNIRTYAVNPGTTATAMTGFRGVPADKVANVVVKAIEESLGKNSGDDVDVWDYI